MTPRAPTARRPPGAPRSPSWRRTCAWPSPASPAASASRPPTTGEELTASTPGRARHHRAARADHPGRARRRRAGAAAEHDPHRRPGSRSGATPRASSTPPTAASRACAITDAGRELLARSRTRKDAYLAQRVAELSDAEQALLARALPLLERLQDDDASDERCRGTFQSMHVRNFRLFFVGQLISQCGTWMQTIALGWLVLQLSHNSGFAIGLAIALQFMPDAAVRRVGRRASPTASTSARCCSCTQVAMAAVAVAARGGRPHRRRAALDALRDRVRLRAWRSRSTTRPASRSCSELVRPADLPNAIGLNSAIFQVARIVGPALGRRDDRGRRHRRAASRSTRCRSSFIIGALLMMRTGELHRDAPLGPREGPGARRPALRVADARAAFDAAAHACRRHVRDQLPGRAAAPGQGHVRRRRRRLQLDDDRRWARARSSARLFVANRSHRTRRPRVPDRVGVRRRRSASPSLAPSLGVFIGLLVLVGAGQIAFLATCNSPLQLRADPVDARPRHGRLHDHAARQHAHRRAASSAGSARSSGRAGASPSAASPPSSASLVFGTAFVRRPPPRRRARTGVGRARRDRARDRRRVDPRRRQVTLVRWRCAARRRCRRPRSSATAGTGSGSPNSAASV